MAIEMASQVAEAGGLLDGQHVAGLTEQSTEQRLVAGAGYSGPVDERSGEKTGDHHRPDEASLLETKHATGAVSDDACGQVPSLEWQLKDLRSDGDRQVGRAQVGHQDIAANPCVAGSTRGEGTVDGSAVRPERTGLDCPNVGAIPLRNGT